MAPGVFDHIPRRSAFSEHSYFPCPAEPLFRFGSQPHRPTNPILPQPAGLRYDICIYPLLSITTLF